VCFSLLLIQSVHYFELTLPAYRYAGQGLCDGPASVLSVHLSRHLHVAAAGSLLGALCARDVDRLLHGRRSAANAGSATLSADVGSWTQSCCYCAVNCTNAVNGWKWWRLLTSAADLVTRLLPTLGSLHRVATCLENPGIWQLSGKYRGKNLVNSAIYTVSVPCIANCKISQKYYSASSLSIAYLRFATASVFSWMFWTRFRATLFLIESFLDILQRRWSRHSLLVALTKIYARNEWHKMVMGAAESGKMSGNSTVSGDWSPCLQYFVFTIYCWAFSTGYTMQLYYCSLWHLTDTL